MNIDQKLEFIKSTIFHELGHLTGYCLANRFEKTDLGKVKSFEVGFPKNLVVPEKSFYHIEVNLLEEQHRIKNATENITRTIAWFIEVISGCTFQSIIEDKKFNNCFSFGEQFEGHLDFSNLATVRNASSFNWNFDELYEIQSEFASILNNEDFVHDLEPIVNKLLQKIKFAPLNQVSLNLIEIEELTNEINEKISDVFINDYKNLINKYYLMFSHKADFVAELEYKNYEQGGRSTPAKSGYRPTIKFDFSEMQTSGNQRFLKRNFAKPGETVLAEITVVTTDFLENKLEVGTVFDFREGPVIIGYGKVIKVINKDLESKKANT